MTYQCAGDGAPVALLVLLGHRGLAVLALVELLAPGAAGQARIEVVVDADEPELEVVAALARPAHGGDAEDDGDGDEARLPDAAAPRGRLRRDGPLLLRPHDQRRLGIHAAQADTTKKLHHQPISVMLKHRPTSKLAPQRRPGPRRRAPGRKTRASVP